MKKVFAVCLLLLTNPGQRQAHRQVDAGGGQPTELQFAGDGGQRKDVVVGIVDLAGQEGLVVFADDVISVPIHQHVVGEDGLPVADRQAFNGGGYHFEASQTHPFVGHAPAHRAG